MHPAFVPSPAALRARVGRELGTSEWMTVTQEDIDAFADVTHDHQWIHCDPARATASPLGTTVAHGYLVLSLLSGPLLHMFGFDDSVTVLNYGLDRVRFPASLPADADVRMHAVLTAAEPAKNGTQLSIRVTVEACGIERPVCVADVVWRLLD